MVIEIIEPVVLASFVDNLIKFIQPVNLIEVVLDGLAKSSLYIMIAIGLTLIFGLMGVLNFAHGSLTMMGAYVGGLVMVLLVSESTGDFIRLIFFFIAVAVVFAVLTGFGSALEMKLIRPLYDRTPIYQILLTFGLTLIFDEMVKIVLQFYDLEPQSEWQGAFGTRPTFFDSSYKLGPIRVNGLDIFEIFFGVLIILGLWYFLNQTRYGLFIRAGSEDSEMTEAMGVNVRRTFTVVFGLGIGVAGVAGALLMWDPSWGASVPLGTDTLLPAFVVVIVGGLGTFRGTLVAGVIVGMVDAVMTWWFNNAIDFAGLPEMTIFLILVVMLIIRPQGIFGVEEVGGH